METSPPPLKSDGRTYATLSAVLAVLSIVCWILFARALSDDFATYCGDGCVLPLAPGVGVGLLLGTAVMFTAFSAATAVTSTLLHTAHRHFQPSQHT